MAEKLTLSYASKVDPPRPPDRRTTVEDAVLDLTAVVFIVLMLLTLLGIAFAF